MITLYRSLLVVCLIVTLPLTSYAKKESPPEVSYDGMTLKKHNRSSTLYTKSNVDFSTYNKVIILPSETAFKKNWRRDYNRDQRSTSSRIREKDVEKIKARVSKIFDEVFTEELSTVEGFTLVEETGPNVLILKPSLINLDVHAPDILSPGRTRTYVETAGEGTILLEMYDAVSGEILVRAIDTRETRDKGYYSWATRVSNTADAKALIRRWAKKLAEKMKDVHKL